ncbi:uncharacterized protein LOC128257225 [Drosophila gunungcola]|uniref:Uncharacterized protein n=1 Tax=Drosophila gunungcola TaxID=103775 RepID=A0A9P9YR95_9MUSC|nr:uncharacterized protein LOC128257225 [Drosophila gunungcola]KAI8041658.1 hypothetical protein M5D96_005923 [Drosophila gunungcola]
MQSAKIINKLLKEAPKNTKGSKEIAELRNLIVEVMKPRLSKLNQILRFRMVPATRDDFQDEGVDWWPDYELYSDSHAITDMNGLLVCTQNSLKGMPDDLRAIGEKFDFAYSVAKPKTIQNKSKKFLLVDELIEDLEDFVKHFSRLCTKILDDRRNLHDLASITLDTDDRIKVKIFDERIFVQLQSRIGNLDNYIRDFCALFEAHVEFKDEAKSGPLSKFAKPQGPLLAGAVNKVRT